jgi:hypothetical protein
MVASKHDGFRVIARKDGAKVRLYSRPGNDLTYRFPLIVESMARLRSRSCIIDGEAVACNDNGLASFDRIRYRRHDATVFLYAFDLIELNGDDLRRDPLEVRKEQSVEPLSCWGFVRPRGGKKFNDLNILCAGAVAYIQTKNVNCEFGWRVWAGKKRSPGRNVGRRLRLSRSRSLQPDWDRAAVWPDAGYQKMNPVLLIRPPRRLA